MQKRPQKQRCSTNLNSRLNKLIVRLTLDNHIMLWLESLCKRQVYERKAISFPETKRRQWGACPVHHDVIEDATRPRRQRVKIAAIVRARAAGSGYSYDHYYYPLIIWIDL